MLYYFFVNLKPNNLRKIILDITKPHRLFLLGGHDLEMWTIKQMLEERDDCAVADKQLHWDNALLSAYEEELSNNADFEIYGIELREDITAPDNYISIDHHNDRSGQPSSLEQVASLLGVTLTQYQQLVAANDKGYISAMMALGASKEKIDEIRKKRQGSSRRHRERRIVSRIFNKESFGKIQEYQYRLFIDL